MTRAVVLLSGGLDSTTCLAVALSDGCEVLPLTFDYDQRHRREIRSAISVVEFYKLHGHRIVKIDNFGGSALTDKDVPVPSYSASNMIPSTYVPARNIIFLGFAAAFAETTGSDRIYIGVNALDYSGYPDCRPEFISAYSRMLNLGMKRGVEGNPLEIATPLINLRKSEIIRLAVGLNTPLYLTTSCYNGGEKACGVCDSCVLRLRGFADAGITDPIPYEE